MSPEMNSVKSETCMPFWLCKLDLKERSILNFTIKLSTETVQCRSYRQRVLFCSREKIFLVYIELFLK